LLSSSINLLSEGQYTRAQKVLLQGLNLARTPEEKRSALFYLAETNASLGQLAQAAERYHQCLEIVIKLMILKISTIVKIHQDIRTFELQKNLDRITTMLTQLKH